MVIKPSPGPQTAIKKNEAEVYVMIYKDAHDILLSEQKVNCETKYLLRSLFTERQKEKKCRSIYIYLSIYIYTHTHTHTHLYLQKQEKK